ncbi:MAG: N-6 DNA methylase [Elusimicrobiota bacterium]|jgi:type I restriction enzyme M protein|nr:N-6 DNA methylase [Elusimicrobiota bacterium]
MKIKENYIIDFISGQKVKATPEEIEAVQVFSKQLIEDYNYPKEYVQTRPQFRVKARPSDIKKEYPIDIAVFSNEKKQNDNIYIIVECKKKNRKDGKTQLQDYLRFSRAYLGVWFNGEERLFLKKFEKNGRIEFEEIPNIPKFRQRIEDIGKFKRKDLKPTHNLKSTFRAIRNHLAANTIGTTRDEALAEQLINLIFCKIYDEKFTKQNDIVSFRAGVNEKAVDVKKRILEIFEKVKKSYKEILDETDEINLDDNSILYVVGELQNYCLMEAERDIIADAFETFIGHALKGSQGQFFTPRNVVKMMVAILDPNEEDLIIDPACGSGGFLIEGLKYVWQKIDKKGEEYGWGENEIEKIKQKVAIEKFRGIDKDYFLSKVTKVYMTLVGDGKSGVFCEDSLERVENWNKETQIKIKQNSFDIVLTNPPFGKDIKVEGEEKLKQYDLSYKYDSNNNKTNKLKISESPQILFIERCLQLLKPNGRMGIVLPDGFFNESGTYIRKWLLKNVKIFGIIDVCKETFQPNTSTKTSILFFEKVTKQIIHDYEIFMGIAYFCGHNRRGIEINKDDIPEITNKFKHWINTGQIHLSRNCFITNLNELEKTNFWIPKHFSPYYKQAIEKVKSNYAIVKLGDIATFRKGDEVGSANYIDFIDRVESDIPFIRTSDLVNSSVNQTPDNFIDKETYLKLNQNLKQKDILYTKDGKIGVVGMITENDKVVISSGILIIRLKKDMQKKYGITPEYLFAILSNKYTGYFQALRSTIIAATIPHLREKRIEYFDIPILDIETIREITNLVHKSFQLKDDSKILDIETANILKKKLQIEES